MLLVQNAADAGLDQLHGFLIADAGRHHQNPSFKALAARAYDEIDRAIRRAVQLEAFLEDVPYARYDRRNAKRRGHLR